MRQLDEALGKLCIHLFALHNAHGLLAELEASKLGTCTANLATAQSSLKTAQADATRAQEELASQQARFVTAAEVICSRLWLQAIQQTESLAFVQKIKATMDSKDAEIERTMLFAQSLVGARGHEWGSFAGLSKLKDSLEKMTMGFGGVGVSTAAASASADGAGAGAGAGAAPGGPSVAAPASDKAGQSGTEVCALTSRDALTTGVTSCAVQASGSAGADSEVSCQADAAARCSILHSGCVLLQLAAEISKLRSANSTLLASWRAAEEKGYFPSLLH